MFWVCSEKFFVCLAHLKQDSQYGHMLALCVACVVVSCVGSMLANEKRTLSASCFPLFTAPWVSGARE